jgi:cellulose synthase/poly-beta-1,6-N-acetylglucosamine synthase-like glycosyltransferase
VEFEAIYAVAHPGRARMHGFGIFGGSNGYWRTEVLRGVRMRPSMLTEDIDASVRALLEGRRIASDPLLLSHELAPATLRALWDQRMRWAQGWFQVSLRHTWAALSSPLLSARQKLGVFHLLVWRELYPWLSIQVLPVLLFWLWSGGLARLNLLVPIFVLTSLLTFSSGPGQALFAYLLGSPAIRRHRGWYLAYLVCAPLCYNGLKNLICRVAMLKEILGERHWKVTPRARTAAPSTTGVHR